MPRPILPEDRLHIAVRARISDHYRAVIDEVHAATAANDVVIVGMAVNPFPRRARRMLDAAGIAYKYLEYGSYLSEWRRRNALKMWTGWPTMPMIFVKGTLIGGASELARLMESGELQALLSADRP